MRLLVIAVAVCMLAASGCASTQQGAVDSSGNRQQVLRVPPARQMILDRSRNTVKNAGKLALEVAAIPLAPIQYLAIMHAYDKAEREGGILP